MMITTGYNPRKAWGLLHPAIVDAGDLLLSGPLLKWLQVATPSTHLANNGIVPSAVVIHLEAPLADENLISHEMQLFCQILPALFQPAKSLELALTQMAAAVMQNTNDTCVACDQKATQTVEACLAGGVTGICL